MFSEGVAKKPQKIYLGLGAGALPVLASLLAVCIFWYQGYLNNFLGGALCVVFACCYLFQIKVIKGVFSSLNTQSLRWEKTAKRLFHDISNHLTVAQLRKERMLDSLSKKPNIQSDYWEREVQSLAKHLDSIDSVISVTQKMNSNSVDSSLIYDTPYLLKDMVLELNPLFSDRFLQKTLDFTVDIDSDFKIQLDRGVLRDCILTNILSNAVKFSDFNSEIIVKAYRRAGLQIIEVIDFGCGMSPLQISHARCYEKNRSSQGTSGEIGSGLGLPLIFEATEHLGGDLEIESPVDKLNSRGTCFRLKFPSA